MRIRGLPSSFHTAAAHAKSDVSDDARARASMVAWIDERRRRGATRNDACRILGISTRTYNRWRATLKRHGIRALTNRTTTRRRRDPWKRREVREAVERLRTQHPCGKEKLAILLAREGIRVSASTVGRVLTELLNRGRIHRIGWTPTRRWRTQRPRAHARRQRPFERAKQPGELIQIDTLVENSLHETRYHFSAIDPTRKYAHARLYHRATSRSAERFLRECLERWPDPIRSIQVDNGSEFRGDFERACADLNLELVTIAPRRPQRNGCVERLQRTFRDEHYAYEPPHLGLDSANDHLDTYLTFYNHHRPHHSLGMQTPMTYTPTRNPKTSQTS